MRVVLATPDPAAGVLAAVEWYDGAMANVRLVPEAATVRETERAERSIVPLTDYRRPRLRTVLAGIGRAAEGQP